MFHTAIICHKGGVLRGILFRGIFPNKTASYLPETYTFDDGPIRQCHVIWVTLISYLPRCNWHAFFVHTSVQNAGVRVLKQCSNQLLLAWVCVFMCCVFFFREINMFQLWLEIMFWGFTFSVQTPLPKCLGFNLPREKGPALYPNTEYKLVAA